MIPSPLPESLASIGRVYRRLFLAIGALTLATTLVALVLFHRLAMSAVHADPRFHAVLAALLVAVTAPVLIVVWILHRRTCRRLADGAQLLRGTPAQVARIRPLGIGSKQGMLAEVRVERPPAAFYALLNPMPGALRIEKHGTVAELHAAGRGIDEPLVVVAGGKAILGRRIDAQKFVRQMRWGVLAGACVLPLLAAILAYMGWQAHESAERLRQEKRWAEQSMAWPAAAGQIMGSAVETVSVSRGRSRGTAYQVRVGYAWQSADGRALTGERLRFCPQVFDQRHEAEAIVAALPPAGSAAVRFDPSQPARSVLQPGGIERCDYSIRSRQMELTVLAVFAGFLLLITGALWRQRQKLADFHAGGEAP